MGLLPRGGFPDNVASFEVVDDKTFAVTTTEAYAPGWYLGNQLNALTPMPAHAWNKTADDGEVSDLDRDPGTAAEVFDYLVSASEDPASYDSNALWDTVSGAWTLESYTPGGEVVLAANENYQGVDAASSTRSCSSPSPMTTRSSTCCAPAISTMGTSPPARSTSRK